MAEENGKKDENGKPQEQAGSIISSIILAKERVKIKGHRDRVINANDIPAGGQGKKVQIIGGDSDTTQTETPPAIVIEKDGEKISKIIVKCPCGRHSELQCEYNEEEAQETENEPPEN